jgi:hypothetical protein
VPYKWVQLMRSSFIREAAGQSGDRTGVCGGWLDSQLTPYGVSRTHAYTANASIHIVHCPCVE